MRSPKILPKYLLSFSDISRIFPLVVRPKFVEISQFTFDCFYFPRTIAEKLYFNAFFHLLVFMTIYNGVWMLNIGVRMYLYLFQMFSSLLRSFKGALPINDFIFNKRIFETKFFRNIKVTD